MITVLVVTMVRTPLNDWRGSLYQISDRYIELFEQLVSEICEANDDKDPITRIETNVLTALKGL